MDRRRRRTPSRSPIRRRACFSARSRTAAARRRSAPSRRPRGPFRPGGRRPRRNGPPSCAACTPSSSSTRTTLAQLLTIEQGKSLAEAKGEVAHLAPPMCCWFAEEAQRIYGDVIPSPWAGPAHPGHQGAGRRRRRDHAVEFPVLDDRPQARAGARRRLHHRRSSRPRRRPIRASPGACCARRPAFPQGRRQRRHRLGRARSAAS